MLKQKSLSILLLVAVIVGLSASSYAVQPPPNPSEVDFCQLFDDTYNLIVPDNAPFHFLINLLGSNSALLTMLQCAVADLNGGINSNNIPLPNGMLDGNYELRVIKELVQNPSKYANLASGTLPGQVRPGVNPTDVLNAYNTNFQLIYTDGMNNLLTNVLPGVWSMLVGMYGVPPLCCTGQNTPPGCSQPPNCIDQSLIVTVFRNLMMVLAGYSTLGDENSAGLTATLAHLLKTTDLINTFLQDMEDNPDNYVRLPQFLSKEGDADGDGYTNYEEYQAFGPAKAEGDAFIAAVLDPSIYPGYVPPAEDKVKIYPRGTIRIEEGGTIDLRVELKGLVEPYSITWTHNGADIPNANSTRLIIRDVTNADAGAYQCVVTDSSKGIFASAVVNVVIVPAGTIPVASGIGLAVITTLCSAGGVMVLRRKRK